MKKLKFGVKLLGVIVFVYMLLAVSTPYVKFLKNRSVKNQINYLIDEAHADEQLQEVYPEGFMFFNALLALSIIEHSESTEKWNTHYATQVEKLINKMLSDQSANIFPLNQELQRGAFYNGWINFTLKKYLNSSLIESSIANEKMKSLYDSLSTNIVNAQKDSLKVLDSYPESNWPADNLVCVVSLSNEHDVLKEEWIDLLRRNSETNLINHSNVNLNVSRGSSQSLIIYLLSEYDKELARKEHGKFKELFIESRLGIQFVKEDLKDKSYYDIDSGPVILGYGSVATIVNVKAQKGIQSPSKFTEGFINLIGMPINFAGKKYYLFKKEKMFDVFMLWIQQ